MFFIKLIAESSILAKNQSTTCLHDHFNFLFPFPSGQLDNWKPRGVSSEAMGATNLHCCTCLIDMLGYPVVHQSVTYLCTWTYPVAVVVVVTIVAAKLVVVVVVVAVVVAVLAVAREWHRWKMLSASGSCVLRLVDRLKVQTGREYSGVIFNREYYLVSLSLRFSECYFKRVKRPDQKDKISDRRQVALIRSRAFFFTWYCFDYCQEILWIYECSEQKEVYKSI